MKVKVDIYSGFLGAGKTMLMKKIIEDGAYEENVAIIENEFGEVSIDGAILRNSNIEVTEINSGCICCQVTGDFKEAIKEVILKYNPERILVEPSGVAKLTEVIEVFGVEELKDRTVIENIITVIDSERFNDYIVNFKEFYVNQIANTKKIVLSRSQNLEEKDIESLVKKIKRINPKVNIIKESWDEIGGRDILNTDEKVALSIKNIGFSRGKVSKGKVEKKDESNEFESFAIYLDRKVSKEELTSKFRFISSCNSYGEVLRAKGIVELIDGNKGQFDFVKDEFIIRNINDETKSVISFIGVNLNRSELDKMFK